MVSEKGGISNVDKRRYISLLPPQTVDLEKIHYQGDNRLGAIVDTMYFSLQGVRRSSGNITLNQHISFQRHEPGLPLDLYHAFPGGSFGKQEIPGKRTQYIWTLSARKLVLAFMEDMLPYCLSRRTKMEAAIDYIRDYQETSLVNLELLEAFREIGPDIFDALPNMDYLGGLFDARGHIRLDESQQKRVWPLLEVGIIPPHDSLIGHLINAFGGHFHDQQAWIISSNQALVFLECISASSKTMFSLINDATSYQKALNARHAERMIRENDSNHFTPLPKELIDVHADQLAPLIRTFNQTRKDMFSYK